MVDATGAVAVGMGIAFVMLVVYLQHKERMVRMERGEDVEKTEMAHMERGKVGLVIAGLFLIAIGAGVGLGQIWYGVTGESMTATLILVFLGIASILSYVLVR